MKKAVAAIPVRYELNTASLTVRYALGGGGSSNVYSYTSILVSACVSQNVTKNMK